jgi:hypothetical protein
MRGIVPLRQKDRASEEARFNRVDDLPNFNRLSERLGFAGLFHVHQLNPAPPRQVRQAWPSKYRPKLSEAIQVLAG